MRANRTLNHATPNAAGWWLAIPAILCAGFTQEAPNQSSPRPDPSEVQPTRETMDLNIRIAQRFRDLICASNYEEAARLSSADPRLWFDEKTGPGRPWTIVNGAQGPWVEWDRTLHKQTEVLGWSAGAHSATVTYRETNDYFQLLRRGWVTGTSTYFITDDGRIEGILHAASQDPRPPALTDAFKAWARAHEPTELEELMPFGDIAPSADHAERMRRLLERFRQATRGRVEQYGQMRSVMREGNTGPMVTLRDILGQPHAFAVGALESLRGEVTIVDGTAWIARAQHGKARVDRVGPDTEEMATLLTSAWVPAWREFAIDDGLEGAELESAIARIAGEAGLNVQQPFPFLLRGQMDRLTLHVINGYCPMAASPQQTADKEPIRWEMTGAEDATVIGFYAPGTAGIMTHHGTSIHAHAVVEKSDGATSGHVDSLRLGHATLALPVSK